jgi:flagellar M-ring protein FliF
MNEWFKKQWARITALFKKLSLQQKLIAGGVALVLLIGIIVLIGVSGAPTSVPILVQPVKDDDSLQRIEAALEREGIRYSVSADNRVSAPDDRTAKRARAILVREDLVPKGTSPWDFLNKQNWTQTDFERDQNLRLAVASSVKEHIESLDDVDSADVIIDLTKKELFSDDQLPYKASVILTPKPGSDIETNRKKIEGIQKLIITAVSGLSPDNIVITDKSGTVLNDFTNMATLDRIEEIKKLQKIVQAQEALYGQKVTDSLQKIYGADRVRDLNLKIDMDMNKKTVDSKEIYPITVKPRTPGLPYDDSDVRESVVISESNQSTDWQGTAMNPQGPAGTEGNTPPNYADANNMNGRVVQSNVVKNYDVNRRDIHEEVTPTVKRLTVSVNIDGVYQPELDASGKPVFENGAMKRKYIPVTPEELKQAEALVMGAVGYDKSRSDSVSVTNIAVDRSKQFKDEDAEYLRQQQLQQTILFILIGLAVLLVSFIVFRLVSREIERRKRLREEELSRQHQIMRERALQQAEEEGIEVSMSVEERKRLEMQENAINMAKEHPEDVAQLIRTWLLEE